MPQIVIAIVWVVWFVSWWASAKWSSKPLKRAGIRRELPNRIVTIVGAYGLFARVPARINPRLLDLSAHSVIAWACVLLVALGFAFTWWARTHLKLRRRSVDRVGLLPQRTARGGISADGDWRRVVRRIRATRTDVDPTPAVTLTARTDERRSSNRRCVGLLETRHRRPVTCLPRRQAPSVSCAIRVLRHSGSAPFEPAPSGSPRLSPY